MSAENETRMLLSREDIVKRLIDDAKIIEIAPEQPKELT